MLLPRITLVPHMRRAECSVVQLWLLRAIRFGETLAGPQLGPTPSSVPGLK